MIENYNARERTLFESIWLVPMTKHMNFTINQRALSCKKRFVEAICSKVVDLISDLFPRHQPRWGLREILSLVNSYIRFIGLSKTHHLVYTPLNFPLVPSLQAIYPQNVLESQSLRKYISRNFSNCFIWLLDLCKNHPFSMARLKRNSRYKSNE